MKTIQEIFTFPIALIVFCAVIIYCTTSGATTGQILDRLGDLTNETVEKIDANPFVSKAIIITVSFLMWATFFTIIV
tara:strand:+ start:795 stop:1025 length:231 start_codon:yes stop_codon:yes gene_type:complete